MDAETRDRIVRLEARMTALERLVDDPYEPRSHRRRLDAVEDNDRGVELAKKVLDEHGATASLRVRQVREWGSFAVAVSAVLIAFFH